jgi:hypothetical protein
VRTGARHPRGRNSKQQTVRQAIPDATPVPHVAAATNRTCFAGLEAPVAAVTRPGVRRIAAPLIAVRLAVQSFCLKQGNVADACATVLTGRIAVRVLATQGASRGCGKMPHPLRQFAAHREQAHERPQAAEPSGSTLPLPSGRGPCLGSFVRTLASGSHASGNHSIQWDGTDHSGTAAAQGFYLVRMQTDDAALSLPLVLTR